ncbi:ExsB family transcriptional regulator [Candidatus Desantisbacteria bacterium CG_4_10_14_0_8_um_filter_48_22]|uniref:GMP synthase (glutamine-hydrolyzing) n=1 Tax=Candidatus Desantisbacteria bacterium CG_4_10_14_0_8_um_filter_48_22 TaxID=1974543 RepID=A0A2M7SBB8_9BACT|nr:MAG: ExsB family transcriptional regulator [Candidatus Desantisbacteria bacterium CG1_02_49_89]PIV55456.1 MAG: ExsB family transcriptional regulator [Candidatus Desantisbacteria bacterium CG02_land_8_20_14_3_00_49_13]PIZ16791.1 MAG: ExsB family transcriptional regulator [Candidatus Desantisbacteria bacterium CG_4_10_14_0_8_um_filter_48_22]PJB27494.1 MAG: ExsB family transcriptional regulator [Candidatus Desantisbacteria bacterium CG_4_9_14_3_um_filter_50_7]
MGLKNVKAYIGKRIKEIKSGVGNKRALVATSGGVDSVTCAVLAHKAIGSRAVILFIDDGLMRQDEGRKVKKDLARLGVNVKILNVRADFFRALKGIEDPEIKRKAFRDTFYKTLGRAVRISKASFMIQGTIAADIMETKAGIKTQHNILQQIGISPRKYGLTILEPIKDLYKFEVRMVARALGVQPEYSERMPFPGPGLATRVIGEVTPERVETLRKATVIVEEEIKKAGIKPFQAFAVLLKDRATGVINGKRTFGQIVVVRSVDSRDAITAGVTRIPFSALEKMQKRITGSVPDVTKVLFDVTPKPPSTIEYI